MLCYTMYYMKIRIIKILHLQEIETSYAYFIFQLSTLNIVGDNIHALLVKAAQHTFVFVSQHNLRERVVAKETVIEGCSRLPEMVHFFPCFSEFFYFLFS